MNSTNINVQGSKSQSHMHVDALIELDRKMSTRHTLNHPWRQALAGALTAQALEIIAIRNQAYEVESRIGNIAILIESIFDKLDEMSCDTPEHHKVHNAVSCFANSAMESAQAIRSANEQILTLTSGGAQ